MLISTWGAQGSHVEDSEVSVIVCGSISLAVATAHGHLQAKQMGHSGVAALGAAWHRNPGPVCAAPDGMLDKEGWVS